MTKSSPLYSPGAVMKDSSFLSASEKIARMSMRAEIIQISANQPACLTSVWPGHAVPETQRQVKHGPQPPRAHG